MPKQGSGHTCCSVLKAKGMDIFRKISNSSNLALRIVFIIVLLSLLSGCDKGGEYKQVNFSHKVDVEKPAADDSEQKTLRVAVAAMISPKETFKFYNELLNYIGEQVNRDIQLIQRKTYGEVNELFAQKKIDLAFICTGPYASGQTRYRFEGLATPVVRGKPFYQSYLIVNIASPFHSLEDLRDHTFAFTDPDSNTGTMVPTAWLIEKSESPQSFFKYVNYTYSHDNSILAVARGLVDGAAVDSHIWEFYQRQNPIHTSKTRVIKKSEYFGSPPIVVSAALAPELKERLREIILQMHHHDEGKQLLKNLLIDKFVTPREEWYEMAANQNRQVMTSREKDTHVSQKP
jgi:phosphonate transport system substrate-binding protein